MGCHGYYSHGVKLWECDYKLLEAQCKVERKSIIAWSQKFDETNTKIGGQESYANIG